MDSRIIFFISFAVIYAECSRILVIPMQGKSHMIATNAIGQELKKNGHEVGSDLYYLWKFPTNVTKDEGLVKDFFTAFPFQLHGLC